MAEITRSIVARQCVSRRIASKEEAEKYIMIWQQERNQSNMTIHWSFTTEDARITRKRFSPVLEQDN